ncbi:Superoxide dismutase [Cu-Zn] precursor (plasmid) [Sinorhizobium sojae CCBAU 05684]|uniref:Superoxide dismutase [Cu-Zn] n=1 Tax=Sinorhizobium sojae CCBAU 05684 TaxID=716928 RepID=A0A249PGT2_9HYPH|nr:superoxide dismutase family protein [Sinorhizobium sojae]ASY65163.1 Superoxide dismutase [Cu-Zn] precursor [Sinorhizobium sojae CCBAU 05684]
MRVVFAFLFALAGPAAGQEQATTAPSVARAVFLNTSGESIGTATLKSTPNGVLIEAKLANLPPGIHGFHIHEVGTCDPATGFESAGGHLGSGPHGFMVEEGPHAGDLANQTARDDGTMLVEVFNERVSFDGEMSLFDDDGAALVVHATADDYRSQPAGTGGDPIACGVIERD